MKRKVLTGIILLCGLSIFAQNAVHQAFDTNGPIGECLFPQDEDGNVKYTGTIEIDATASDILDMLVDYFVVMKAKYNFEILEEGKSSKTLNYKIRCSLGKEYYGFSIWGGTFFSRYKDASKISFKCMLTVRDGSFKYNFSEFWTERNTIKGEAKNDGLPNIIHWQRVNSIKKERDQYVAKHNIEKRSAKEELYDYDIRIKYEQGLYEMEHSIVQKIVNGLNKIEDIGQLDDEVVPKAEPLDISSFKGNLLQEGNNVYLTSSGQPYESAAISELVKQITIDNLWNIVDKENQAHFVLEYHVNTEGRDKAYLVIRDRSGQRRYEGYRTSGSESVSENVEFANNMYHNLFKDVQNIKKGKVSKHLIVFTIE